MRAHRLGGNVRFAPALDHGQDGRRVEWNRLLGSGSPFVPNDFQLDKDAIGGGIIRPGTLGRRFGYDISPKGCPQTESGPDVIVDGGGMGGPGGKH